MQTAGKAFKGIQREEVFAFVNFKELKDNTFTKAPNHNKPRTFKSDMKNSNA